MMKRQYLYSLAIYMVVMICVSMITWSGEAVAESSPVDWWGELGFDYIINRAEKSQDSNEHAESISLNTTGYIYQPWLAAFDGRIGTYFTSSNSDKTDSESSQLFGDVVLRLFPKSRFPLELFAERSDSRTDTNLNTLMLDRKRYGLSQRYISEAGIAFNFDYETSDQVTVSEDGTASEDVVEDVAEIIRLGVSNSFGAHTIMFDAAANRVDRLDSPDITETGFATLRHSYRPSALFSAEDMLTFNRSDIKLGTTDYVTDVTQFNSYAFWRPDTSRPVRVSGSMRVLSRNKTILDVVSDDVTYTGTLGASWEWSKNWIVNSNMGISGFDSSVEEENTSFQSLGAIYSSDVFPLDDIDVSWFGQLDIRNTHNVDDTIQEAGMQAGYDLNSNLISEQNYSLVFNAGQSISVLLDTNNESSQTLLSNISLTWNSRTGTMTNLARISVSDNRSRISDQHRDGATESSQLVNIQLSTDNKLTASSAFMANMTMQATRQDLEPAGGAIDESNGEWSPTVSLDMSYYKKGIFDIPRTLFTSTLRFVSDAYLPGIGGSPDPDERNDRQWENKLEYSVGRLQLRALLRLTQIKEQDQSYLMLQARRQFGGT